MMASVRISRGPGMAALLTDDKPQGYCTGIGADLNLLWFIVVVAAISVLGGLIMFWQRRNKQRAE